MSQVNYLKANSGIFEHSYTLIPFELSMAENRLSGKLAVILHADVASSTALVQQDKQLAHERIQDTFRRFSDTIEKYQGQVLELRGDALLAEFEHAYDAVSAALSFQVDHAYYIDRLKDDPRPAVRVGIAMGEVIIADSTVTGAGVVQAQRIEQLANPGGVCITASIHESLSKSMPFDLENLGEQVLKGFDDPVRVYRIELSSGASIPPPHQESQPRSSQKSLQLKAVIAVVVVGIGIAYLFKSTTPMEEAASIERMVFPLPDKPSIAVLPFTNMSEDPKQEYFADGMTEDLITDLSQISGLFVIARNSSFSYKGKPVEIRQVAEELGVRYVLEGSMRRSGGQVRINAQLIDATTGGHIWAERYDGSPENVFALQDKVTRQIVTALKTNLTADELTRQGTKQTDNPEAYDAFLQGWAYYNFGTRANYIKSRPFFEEAIRLDPSYARAHGALAAVYWDAYINEWAFELGILSYDIEPLWQKHLGISMKVPNSLAYILQSKVMLSMGRYEEAALEAQKAVDLDGNDAVAIAGLANALVLAGRPEEGLRLIQNAMRLDPRHPPNYLIILGAAEFGMGRYEEAVLTFQRAAKRNPDNQLPLIYMASSYGHLGNMDKAENIIEMANDLRARLGLNYLSLEKSQGDSSPFQGGIDFPSFGTQSVQERLRVGLSEIPALTWQYLIRSSYNFRWEVPSATEIDIVKAKAFHDKGVVFIDLSDPGIWNKEHIPGAINLPGWRTGKGPWKNLLKQTTLQEVVSKNEEVVFYRCSGSYCGRGEGLSAKAVNWGYKKVFFLVNGTIAWKKAGYPVESNQ